MPNRDPRPTPEFGTSGSEKDEQTKPSPARCEERHTLTLGDSNELRIDVENDGSVWIVFNQAVFLTADQFTDAIAFVETHGRDQGDSR